MLFAAWPSFTVTVTVAVPLALATGVNAMLPVAFGLVYVTVGFGISPVFEELAVTVSVWLSPPPAAMPLSATVCCPGSSLIVSGESAFSVGGSFTAFTVTRNVCTTVLFADWPSSTVTVTVAVPLAFATGVKPRLPVAFGLVYVTVGFGISPVFEELAVTVSVWLSPPPAAIPRGSPSAPLRPR